MSWHFNGYMLPLIISALVCGWIVHFVRRRPHAPGAWSLAALMFTVSAWCVSTLIEIGLSDPSAEILWHKITYVMGDLVAPSWVALTLDYTERGAWLRWRWRWLLLWVPVGSSLLLFVLGDPSGLVWAGLAQDTSGPFPVVVASGVGAWFWIDLTYAYGGLLVGAIVLGGRLVQSSRLYRQQTGTMLAAMGLPWLANVLSMLGVGPVPGFDWSPCACAFTSAVLVWGLFRFHFLDVVPVAHSAIFAGLSDSVIVLDAQRRIVDLNPAAQTLLRVDARVSGKRIAEAVPHWHELIDLGESELDRRAEVRLGDRTFDARVSLLGTMRPDLAGRLIVLRDISELKRLQASLEHQAYHDPLSSLPNRALFKDRLAQAVARGGSVAVLFLDLDNFKQINDVLGHAAGDELLVIVAERLRGCVPASATLARLGGDEFTVLLEGVNDIGEPVALAEAIADQMRPPVRLEAQRVQVSISIGIALGANAELGSSELLRQADVALYAAKAQGKACYAVYRPAMETAERPRAA